MELEKIIKTIVPSAVLTSAFYLGFDELLKQNPIEVNATMDLVFFKYEGLNNFFLQHKYLHDEIFKIASSVSVGTCLGIQISTLWNKFYK